VKCGYFCDLAQLYQCQCCDTDRRSYRPELIEGRRSTDICHESTYPALAGWTAAERLNASRTNYKITTIIEDNFPSKILKNTLGNTRHEILFFNSQFQFIERYGVMV